ncbi:hypothetical protein M9Y10_017781 [Tritrichomonas musculus]|uniref:Uncharacterized protein n=1 Tax=Tritrichomonas musculus TaxID=1915356 RepID=A0ABR2HUQ0_9EUKA
MDKAKNDPFKKFITGKMILEGMGTFPRDRIFGLMYIKESMKENCIDSKIYYIHQLIKGRYIPQNLVEAEKILNEINQEPNIPINFLYGKLYKKMDKYSLALEHFKKGSKEGDKECLYEYGKMLFLGEGIKKNDFKATKQFT